jgi:hypothetical protein
MTVHAVAPYAASGVVPALFLAPAAPSLVVASFVPHAAKAAETAPEEGLSVSLAVLQGRVVAAPALRVLLEGSGVAQSSQDEDVEDGDDGGGEEEVEREIHPGVNLTQKHATQFLVGRAPASVAPVRWLNLY